MTDTRETEPGKPRRLWLRVLFGVSLAMNVAVVGIVAGAAWRFSGSEAGHRGPPSSFGAALFRDLPRTERKAMWSQMRKTPGQRRAAEREDAAALLAALRSEPFAQEQAAELVRAHTARRESWMETALSAWLERVAAMSPSERADYADRLEQSFAGKRHRHKKN
ncbi:MAG: periplasmic heavy metal sensor [Sedimentitalea sp.]